MVPLGHKSLLPLSLRGDGLTGLSSVGIGSLLVGTSKAVVSRLTGTDSEHRSFPAREGEKRAFLLTGASYQRCLCSPLLSALSVSVLTSFSLPLSYRETMASNPRTMNSHPNPGTGLSTIR